MQLRYFQVTAKHEHLTRAADELNISQPALSKMISKLEENLGYELFDRVGRNIKLNNFGESYLGTVEKIFLSLQEGEAELDQLAGKENNIISIAVTIPTILPELLGEFNKMHPEARFKQRQVIPSHIKKLIETGEIDLCISTQPVFGDDIMWLPLIEEEIQMAVPLTHSLANKKEISLKQLCDEPFIVMPKGYQFREMTELFCMKAGFYPKIMFEGEETGITYQLVEQGIGIAFYPTILSAERIQKINMAKLKIVEPKCSRTVGLVWNKNRIQSKMLEHFIQFTETFLRNRYK
ncbi:LysR family transcriptional regulator [Rummeliibacillus sp. JY-2-4R]